MARLGVLPVTDATVPCMDAYTFTFLQDLPMRKLLFLLVFIHLVICPMVAQRRSRGSGRKDVHVSGYQRKNGTYVRSHDRAAPGLGRHPVSYGRRQYHVYSSHARRTHSPSNRSSGTRSNINNYKNYKRSAAARGHFERDHPCPSTGKRSGSCHGYVVDHIKPLACGGADSPLNMQWQTAAESKAKDNTERQGCK